ncbi:MAG: hypothetical protein ACPHAN_02990 [Pseudomonadales bacterium]
MFWAKQRGGRALKMVATLTFQLIGNTQAEWPLIHVTSQSGHDRLLDSSGPPMMQD